jgi:hypothetical protein
MGRPKKTVPSVRFGCCLPQDLDDRLSKHLFSEVEDRVPHGAKSTFVESLIRDYFTKIDGEVSAIENQLEL